MRDGEREREMAEAKKRAQEAREAWKRARDDMRKAFRQSRQESRRDRAERYDDDDDLDESIEEMVEAARDFGREVSDEARRLANEVWKNGKKGWEGNWQVGWRKMFGPDWQDHWVVGGRRFRQWMGGSEEANPFVAAMFSKGGGLLALYVLHLLDEQPRHGNEIMRQIESRTMGSWTNNPGAMYPLLNSMEERGLVRSKWEDPDKRTRRIYHITSEGKVEEERLRKVLRPKLMEAIEVLHILYDELYGSNEEPTTPPAGGGADVTDAEGSRQADSGPNAESDQGTVHSTSDKFEEDSWRGRLRRFLGGAPEHMPDWGKV